MNEINVQKQGVDCVPLPCVCYEFSCCFYSKTFTVH